MTNIRGEMSKLLAKAIQRMRTAAHINRCFARSVELGTLEADEPKSADYYNGKADAYAEAAQHLETRNV
ncbi:hypothetical protein GJ25_gp096 [Mycobacterium phage Hawkeye]|uniref:Uncharacterized protein n=1 Tax=Mycobacterium phage Hawkeye TaxID=1458711 RepID=X2KNB4_9CAUD|nr:hypothetical protein GJ25_gp096 [Mycobacterium phage Hawkeye]AHN84107.1 hypothetical protein PBI_HAWKEYE_96 [Mycobacterium phage Hawkeye]